MSLLGYAKCLGKAVPVYDNTGLVSNPRYARFYISELPTFSAADYSYITNSFGMRLLRFTEADFLAIMSKGAFETVGDFPFLALLHRTDAPRTTPYGYNWIRSSDDRAYAICNYTDSNSAAPENVEYFDLYITGDDYSLYSYILGFAIRYNGQDDFKLWGTVGAPIKADRSGTYLTETNVGNYLVMSATTGAEIPTITKDLTAVEYFYEQGSTANALSIAAEVSDGGTLTYQWYRSGVAGTGWIEGATDPSYKPPTDTIGSTVYHCQVTNTASDGQTAHAYSSSVTITVTESSGGSGGEGGDGGDTGGDTGGGETPTLPETPAVVLNGTDVTYTIGDTAEMLICTGTVSDGGTLSYEWYEDATLVATGNSFTPPTSEIGAKSYYCVVTNTLNGYTASASSVPVTITVQKRGFCRISFSIGFAVGVVCNNVSIVGSEGNTTESTRFGLHIPSYTCGLIAGRRWAETFNGK